MKPYKLPKEFTEKWIAALRSGEYKQGYGRYYTSEKNCYCSIGVGLKANQVLLGTNSAINNIDYNLLDAPNENGTLWVNVVSLNDDKKKSFPEIADWLELNVELV